MAQSLQIDAALITESLLNQQHQGEREILVREEAIITPSARDYLRLHRVTIMTGRAASAAPVPRRAAESSASTATGMGTPIQEVLPPGAEGGLLYRGRCDHPDRSFGCRTEEFGSGFVEPACCPSCAAKGSNGGAGCDCEDCGPSDDAEFEALVQRLTDEIMTRLNG